MINLHHLRMFHDVATAGSFVAGAESLMVSQPAVSKQVRQLERALKIRLLDRHARGVTVTEAGRLLLGYASRIFTTALEAEEAIAHQAAGRTERLAIAAGPTAGVYLLPAAVVRFRQARPAAQLRMHTVSAEALLHLLQQREVDLAITETPVDRSRFAVRVLFQDLLVPVASKSDGIAHQKTTTTADFCRQPYIARETTTGEKSLAERTLNARGVRPIPAITVGSTEAIKQAVLAGVGVAMVSRLAIRTEVAAGQLVELPIPRLRIRYPIQLVTRRGEPLGDAARQFVKMVTAVKRR